MHRYAPANPHSDETAASCVRNSGKAMNVSRRLDRSRGRADSSARRPVIRSMSEICRNAPRSVSTLCAERRVEQCADGLLTCLRHRGFARRMMQPVTQQSAAHRRAAGVEQRTQRGRFGAAQCFGEFKIAARGGVEPDIFRLVLDLQAAHVTQLLALRGRGIQQQRAGRAACAVSECAPKPSRPATSS